MKREYNPNLTIQPGPFANSNNVDVTAGSTQNRFNLRQSGVVIHYRGIGLGYSNYSHWWGPGFHSSIVLSSNAPGMKTYTLGTFRDLRINKFSIGLKTIISPYNSNDGTSLYFSGLATHLTYHSNPTITLGLFRTFLSGNFRDLSSITSMKEKWTMSDAFRLIFEPLFGQSKSNLDYTVPGTPGFDAWDEVLTGFVNFTFPEQLLKVYLEIASDDNRGNLSDLKAHWDHTLGYLIGFRKYLKWNKRKLLIGSEYLSTKISNTFNPKFFRGYPNTPNYYAKIRYDYFTYKGRRIAAHSGPSSDELIFVLGYSDQKTSVYFYYNIERHGIKTVSPELKYELSSIINYNITKNNSVFLNIEYEYINNFGFSKNDFSKSTLLWLGYSFSIN
jgi:hypothetical protein